MDHFREQIEKAMLAKDWGTLELAEASGITRAYIYRILNGEQNPSLEVADRLASALGLKITTTKAK